MATTSGSAALAPLTAEEYQRQLAEQQAAQERQSLQAAMQSRAQANYAPTAGTPSPAMEELARRLRRKQAQQQGAAPMAAALPGGFADVLARYRGQ